MDHVHPTPTSEKLTGSHCQSLRHKGMYVMSVPNPAEAQCYDSYDSTAYWCTETARGFGPDGHPVRPDCCNSDRDCCKH